MSDKAPKKPPADAIRRQTRLSPQPALFDVAPDWRPEWWGMPEFTMGDASPLRRVTINFMTREDVARFAAVTGLPITDRTDSAWFPAQGALRGEVEYRGPLADSIYPVCIPSKGRAAHQTTGRVLESLGVSHRFFVEETEAAEYERALGSARVVSMPFHDLGLGSIPARNFIWDWAVANGYARHWCLDDNIRGFARTNANRRLRVKGGRFFQAMETFVDRYENIALAGPHHLGFAPDRDPNLSPFLLNSRVYSCILIDSSLPYRWRGRYNEDTDLSLRALKDGRCTLLFRALLMDKAPTVGVRNSKPVPGGNTDNVYNGGDARLSFAQSLADQHPDCVPVVWKFERWHHQVDYSGFAGNRLRLKPGVVPLATNNNFGMELSYATSSAEAESDSDCP